MAATRLWLLVTQTVCQTQTKQLKIKVAKSGRLRTAGIIVIKNNTNDDSEM